MKRRRCNENPTLSRDCWRTVLYNLEGSRYERVQTLMTCRLVCKEWAKIASENLLWLHHVGSSSFEEFLLEHCWTSKEPVKCFLKLLERGRSHVFVTGVFCTLMEIPLLPVDIFEVQILPSISRSVHYDIRVDSDPGMNLTRYKKEDRFFQVTIYSHGKRIEKNLNNKQLLPLVQKLQRQILS